MRQLVMAAWRRVMLREAKDCTHGNVQGVMAARPHRRRVPSRVVSSQRSRLMLVRDAAGASAIFSCICIGGVQALVLGRMCVPSRPSLANRWRMSGNRAPLLQHPCRGCNSRWLDRPQGRKPRRLPTVQYRRFAWHEIDLARYHSYFHDGTQGHMPARCSHHGGGGCIYVLSNYVVMH